MDPDGLGHLLLWNIAKPAIACVDNSVNVTQADPDPVLPRQARGKRGQCAAHQHRVLDLGITTLVRDQLFERFEVDVDRERNAPVTAGFEVFETRFQIAVKMLLNIVREKICGLLANKEQLAQ